MSVHIGVRKFDDVYYPTLSDTISCERDALEFGDLAAKMKFTSHVLAGEVSVASAKSAIATAAQVLEAGDYFLLTVSTHGYPACLTVPRGWCFSDKRIDRDEGKKSPDSVERWLREFKAGVRVLIVANCCYAGLEDGSISPRALVLPARIAFHIARLDPRFLEESKGWKKWWSTIWKTTAAPKKVTFDFHLYELAACGANKLTDDGPSDKEMCPFSKRVYELVDSGGYQGIADFMSILEANCAKQSMPEPMLTPFDAQDANFAKAGPWRIV